MIHTISIYILLFLTLYLSIGAILALLPIYDAWIERQVQSTMRVYPLADEGKIRLFGQILFGLLWVAFWLEPLIKNND